MITSSHCSLFGNSVRDDGVFSEVRVAVVGNVDSGKSTTSFLFRSISPERGVLYLGTLLGVLSKGVLDNGRGAARLNIFKHKHGKEPRQGNNDDK